MHTSGTSNQILIIETNCEFTRNLLLQKTEIIALIKTYRSLIFTELLPLVPDKFGEIGQ